MSKICECNQFYEKMAVNFRLKSQQVIPKIDFTKKASDFNENELTETPHMRGTFAEMAKWRILMNFGWFDQLMGGVDQPKYFGSGVAHMGGAASPIFDFTNKF